MSLDLLVPQGLCLAIGRCVDEALDLAKRGAGDFRLGTVPDHPKAMRGLAPAGGCVCIRSLRVIAEELGACFEIVGIRLEQRLQASRFGGIQFQSFERQTVWIVFSHMSACRSSLRPLSFLRTDSPAPRARAPERLLSKLADDPLVGVVHRIGAVHELDVA